jgi:hypothetical protein
VTYGADSVRAPNYKRSITYYYYLSSLNCTVVLTLADNVPQLPSLKMSPGGNFLQEVAVKRTARSTTELRRVEVFGQEQSGAPRSVDAREKHGLLRGYRQQGLSRLQHGNGGRGEAPAFGEV